MFKYVQVCSSMFKSETLRLGHCRTMILAEIKSGTNSLLHSYLTCGQQVPICLWDSQLNISNNCLSLSLSPSLARAKLYIYIYKTRILLDCFHVRRKRFSLIHVPILAYTHTHTGKKLGTYSYLTGRQLFCNRVRARE